MIAQRDDAVALDFDGQAVDIALIVEGGRDLDGKGAGGAFRFHRRRSTGCC